jgi:hypothetical protein
MDNPVGFRVSLRLGNPDPGMPGGFELPRDPITGTISGSFVGVHGRKCYYVMLDRQLELDIDARAVSVVDESAYSAPSGRRTRVIYMFESVDTERPPADVLGPGLIREGRAEAGVVELVFGEHLPARIDLAEAQEDDRRVLAQRKWVDIGYAEVEVT